MYVAHEHGKARQFVLMINAQEQSGIQPKLLGNLLGNISSLLMAIGQKWNTQRQYGTVLHHG